MNSQPNSHTHCQAAQANAQTKAWQRVCLSNRTTKTTDKPTDEEEHRTDNSGFAKKRVQCKPPGNPILLHILDGVILGAPPPRNQIVHLTCPAAG